MKKTLAHIMAIALVTVLTITVAMAGTRVVSKVISGNTVEIAGGFKAHFTGVKVPELDEFYGQEAYEFVKKELEGVKIVMATYTTNNNADGIVYDENGIAWMNAGIGDAGNSKGNVVDFNAVLIEKGFGEVDDRFPIDEIEHYRALEKAAKQQKLGIWSKPECPDCKTE